jgi:hypothetical protein
MPLRWHVDDDAALACRFDEPERRAQNTRLCFGVFGSAKIIAHRVIDEERAGWIDQRGQVAARCHVGGCDATFLDQSADQTHGLVIEGSSGGGE